MRKNYLLFLLFAIICLTTKSSAQTLPCYADEARQRLLAAHPEYVQLEAEYNRQIKEGLKQVDLNKYGHKITDQLGNDSFWYDVPIVIHVIHDYNDGSDYMTDDVIFEAVTDWNNVYAGTNSDLSTVIRPFTPYIGTVHIRLHLASIDPNGNPTHGITRHRSYLTYIGSDQSKLDDWPASSYVNIWSVNTIPGSAPGTTTIAYAYLPPTAAIVPYWDGVISIQLSNSSYTGSYVDKTINHEIGHVFNLYHPWGTTNQPDVACGDDDVDDTPPTMGHFSTGCAYDQTAIYDSVCASNYFKIYPSSVSGVDSVAHYPDTANAQNIMDYTECARMFTKGQVARMDSALNSTVADRINLWDSTNLMFTGVTSIDPATGKVMFTPRIDLKPIPEFSPTYNGNMSYFTFPGTPLTFTNETWNDTVTNLTWSFSNGATLPTSTSLTTVDNSFSVPGWVSMTMTATGNNTGDTTVTWPNAVFVANTTGAPANGYFEEFNGGDVASWPMFNYYNNEFKWRLANVGYYDNSSIEYVGYDSRVIPSLVIYPVTGNPNGDFDDLYSVPMDLSSFAGQPCNLNFYYSGATRSSNSADINDVLEIDYSVNKSNNWETLTSLTKSTLDNKGAVSVPYAPLWQGDWAPQSIPIPASVRTNYVVFRFRYKPGQTAPDAYGVTFSSGNNFYLDRINFSSTPASVSNVKLDNTDVVLAPNPTNGNAYVIIKDASSATAQIVVTDITGKVIYTTEQQINGQTEIMIPHDAISVKGVYMVQTITGSQVYTQKLIVD